MLILLLEPTPQKGEVVIGDNITIRLLDIYKDTNQIRLGIEAPKDMVIDRKAVRELRERRIKDVFNKHVL